MDMPCNTALDRSEASDLLSVCWEDSGAGVRMRALEVEAECLASAGGKDSGPSRRRYTDTALRRESVPEHRPGALEAATIRLF